MELLDEIIIIFAISSLIILICHRIRIPAVVGFLLAGVVAGPFGLGLVEDHHQVEEVAELGVIFLLFTIGIEFSFNDLLRLKRPVLLGGGLQVLLTAALGYFAAGRFLTSQYGPAIFAGLLIALSSTAVVLKLVQERGDMDTPYGRLVLAVLIFQDIAAVPIMVAVPIMAGMVEDPVMGSLILTGKAVVVVGLVIALSKWVVPAVLHQVARTRNRELFLVTIVVLCFAIAYMTSQAKLSLALGAFLAGLIISESPYSHQALAEILPFRDIFTSLFFVSIGMLLDVGFLWREAGLVLLATLGVMAAKFLVMTLVAVLLGYPFRTSFLTGMALCQVGEFSFVIAKAATGTDLLTSHQHQLFLAVSVLTMIMAALIISLAPKAANRLENLPGLRRLRTGLYPIKGYTPPRDVSHLENHLVVVGFGLTGRNLIDAAVRWNIPFAVIEMNPATVRTERAKGLPIFFGDASRPTILEAVHITRAKVVVVAISDPLSTRGVTKAVRDLNPTATIYVRTRFFSEIEELKSLGADEVIPEEFETSIEIFSRVLGRYYVPSEDINRFIDQIRASGYQMSRPKASGVEWSRDLNLPDVEIVRKTVLEGALLAGRSLGEIELRKKFGLTLLAICRGKEVWSNPGSDAVIESGDVLLAVGNRETLKALDDLLGGFPEQS